MASKAQAAPTAWVFLTPSPFPFLKASQQNSSFWNWAGWPGIPQAGVRSFGCLRMGFVKLLQTGVFGNKHRDFSYFPVNSRIWILTSVKLEERAWLLKRSSGITKALYQIQYPIIQIMIIICDFGFKNPT